MLASAWENQLGPLLLVAMMKTESRFRSKVIGQHGEIGLIQILPSSAQWIAAQSSLPWHGREALFDPHYNVRLGAAY